VRPRAIAGSRCCSTSPTAGPGRGTSPRPPPRWPGSPKKTPSRARAGAAGAQLLLLAGDVERFDALADQLPESARAPLAALLAGIDPLRAEATLGRLDTPHAQVIHARLLAGRAEPGSLDRARGLLEIHRAEGQTPDAARRAAYALARAAVFEALGALEDAQEVIEEAGILLLHRVPTHDPIRTEMMLARARLDLARGQL